MWDLFQLHFQLSTLEQGKMSDAASKSLSTTYNECTNKQTCAGQIGHA